MSFHERLPIDLAKATEQHRAYQDSPRRPGGAGRSLPAEPELPDAIVVEHPAVAKSP
jgi:hypothetical protein